MLLKRNRTAEQKALEFMKQFIKQKDQIKTGDFLLWNISNVIIKYVLVQNPLKPSLQSTIRCIGG